MGGQSQTGGTTNLREFFHGQDVGQGVPTCAAEFLGKANACQAQLNDLVPGLFREAVLLVDFVGNRGHFPDGKFAHHVADHGLIFRQL